MAFCCYINKSSQLGQQQRPLAQETNSPKPSGVQARDTIQQEMSAAAAEGRPRRTPGSSGSQPAVRYSRLDADIAAMQRDSGTYCDEPDDTQAYAAWLKVLRLSGRPRRICNNPDRALRPHGLTNGFPLCASPGF